VKCSLVKVNSVGTLLNVTLLRYGSARRVKENWINLPLRGRQQAVAFLKKSSAKDFYLRWGGAGDAAVAQRNQKFFGAWPPHQPHARYQPAVKIKSSSRPVGIT
jgi:hypothetical protein